MELNDILMIGLGGLGSLLMWLIFGPLMSGKGLSGWISSASRGKSERDKKKRESLFQLFDLMLLYASERQIKTGKKIKIPSGEVDEKENPIMVEREEILTPIQMLSKTMGNEVIVKVRGMMGGKESQLQAQMAKAMSESGGDYRAMIPMAMKAASQGNYGPALAILMQMLSTKKEVSTNNQVGPANGQPFQPGV